MKFTHAAQSKLSTLQNKGGEVVDVVRKVKMPDGSIASIHALGRVTWVMPPELARKELESL